VSLSRCVVLDVVLVEDAGKGGNVGCDQGAISVFEEFPDLGFVGFHFFPGLSTLLFGLLLVYKADIHQEASVIPTSRALALFLSFLVASPIVSPAQSAPAATDKPFVVEYYYKAKWGHADEFLKLFKKNHYPVLKKEMEMGRIAKVWMDQPRYHTTEDGRWDYRVTIIFKNATVANESFDEATLQKQMYPDQETFQREEQRRFEILDGHWDLPVRSMDLEK
jgi:hypothetical protein